MNPEVWVRESTKEREDKLEKAMSAVLERDGEVNGKNPKLQEDNKPQYSPV